MVEHAIQVGDTVRAPWGTGQVVGDVVELIGSRHAVVTFPVLGATDEVLDTSTVTFPATDLDVVTANVVEDRDITPPGMDGWIHRYLVAVGEEIVPVEVWCSGTAMAMAAHHDGIRAIVKDRGRAAATEAAKHAQPRRGATAQVRCDSRGPTVTYDYGRTLDSHWRDRERAAG